MSGLIGSVSQIYQGDRVDTVRGPAKNKIEREIDLAKEILDSEILVAQPLPPPKKTTRCPPKREVISEQKGGRAKITKKKPTKRVQPVNRLPAKKQKKNGSR